MRSLADGAQSWSKRVFALTQGLGKTLGGTSLFHQRHEQSIGNKEGTRVRAHYLPSLKPHGTAATSIPSVQTLLKHAVLPV